MELKKLGKTALLLVAAALGVWLFAAAVVPLALPFLLAFLLALVTEPAAMYLMERCRFPRWAAGALCTLAVYGLAGGGLFFLLRWLGREAGSLLAELPARLQGLSAPLSSLQEWLTGLASRLPDGLGEAAAGVVEEFFHDGAGLLQRLPETIFSLLTSLARKLPALFLFAVTTVAASFMTAARLPQLRRWLSRVLPGPWRQKLTRAWHRTRQTAGGWLKAQGKLMLVTLAVTAVGLTVLQMPYPLLAGLGVTAVDALPILGSGTVLIPWALWLLLQRETARGVGLLVLYAAAALTRAALEPRLVGRQMGLPPLLTLAAIYVGARLCGIWGMILFPLGASVSSQLIRLAKTDP